MRGQSVRLKPRLSRGERNEANERGESNIFSPVGGRAYGIPCDPKSPDVWKEMSERKRDEGGNESAK